MKKRVLIAVLAGAIAASVLFVGCSQSNNSDDSKKAEETTTASVAETTADVEESTEAVTEAVTEAETEAETEQETLEEATEAETEATTSAAEETPVEEATRTDGSVLTTTEYRDAIWKLTMALPESWQDNIYVLNNNGSEGRTLTFVEKTNYDSGKEYGLLFRLYESDKEIETTNNDRSLGSFTDDNGNTVYISIFTPSDVQANLLEEGLAENYSNVFKHKDEAISAIVLGD